MSWLLPTAALLDLPWLGMGAFVPRWALLAVFLPLLMQRRAVTWLDLAFWAWIAAMLLRLPSIPNRWFGLESIIMLVLVALASFCDFKPKAWFWLAIGLVPSVGFALAERLGYHTFPSMGTASDPAGLFAQHEVLGEALVLGLIALLPSARKHWPLLLLLAFGLWLSHSRGAWAGFGVGLIIMLWLRSKTAAIAVSALAFVLASAFINLDSLIPRLEMWQVALRHSTIWGFGPSSFYFWFPTLLPFPLPMLEWPEWPHNEFVNLWFELGIFALAPLVFMTMLWLKARGWERAMLAATAVMASLAWTLHDPLPALVLGLLLGQVARRQPVLTIPWRFPWLRPLTIALGLTFALLSMTAEILYASAKTLADLDAAATLWPLSKSLYASPRVVRASLAAETVLNPAAIGVVKHEN